MLSITFQHNTKILRSGIWNNSDGMKIASFKDHKNKATKYHNYLNTNVHSLEISRVGYPITILTQ